MSRPHKDDYYLNIAKAVSARSTCLRRRFGAVIIKNDVIISTGYNGPARGVVNCFEVGCLKDELDVPSYSGYDYCIAVHAEENAIINAARNGAEVNGGILYLYGEDAKTGEITEANPCRRCRRAIINAGIKKVVIRKSENEIKLFDVGEWIKEDSKFYMDEMKKAKKIKNTNNKK
ncbi:MAG: deoxycytidylate deaminase [Candidatus Odinarchaeia archaeon]